MCRKPTTIKLTVSEITELINKREYKSFALLNDGTVFCRVRQQLVIIQRYKPRTIDIIINTI